jgi:hypothetical protein
LLTLGGKRACCHGWWAAVQRLRFGWNGPVRVGAVQTVTCTPDTQDRCP